MTDQVLSFRRLPVVQGAVWFCVAEPSTARLFAACADAGASKALLADIAGEQFHDFKSPLATPKVALVARLYEEGLERLAERVKEGIR